MNTKANIVKSNALAAATRGYTLGEMRLLTCVIAQISRDDQYSPNTLYTVAAADLVEATKSAKPRYRIKRTAAANIIMRSAERLYQRNIIIDLGNGDYQQQRWTSFMEVSPNRSEVAFNIAPHVAQYLFDLSKQFLTYNAAETITFRSKYTLPIYELLMQWKDKGVYDAKLETVREAIAIGDKYQDSNNFRVRILDPVISDINACTPYRASYSITKKDHDQWLKIKFYKTDTKTKVVTKQPTNRLEEYGEAIKKRKALQHDR